MPESLMSIAQLDTTTESKLWIMPSPGIQQNLILTTSQAGVNVIIYGEMVLLRHT